MVRETSIEAYNTIRDQGMLSRRRWQTYDGLYKHGPCTGNELIKKIINEDSGYHAFRTQTNILTRLGELRDMGCVKELGETTCSITKMKVILWDVTGVLPKKLTREIKETTKEKLSRAIEVIKFYSESAAYEDTECVLDSEKNIYGKWIFDHGEKAREFLESIK